MKHLFSEPSLQYKYSIWYFIQFVCIVIFMSRTCIPVASVSVIHIPFVMCINVIYIYYIIYTYIIKTTLGNPSWHALPASWGVKSGFLSSWLKQPVLKPVLSIKLKQYYTGPSKLKRQVFQQWISNASIINEQAICHLLVSLTYTIPYTVIFL